MASPDRCAVPYPLLGRHHRTRALQNRILVRARLHVCGIRGSCGGAGMCHSHVCITGMSLAGVYYIYYVNIFYVNDTTKNEIVVIGCNVARLPHTAVQGN